MRLSMFGGLFGVAVNGVVTLLRLIVLGLGAWLVTKGRFTLGGLVAFLGVDGRSAESSYWSHDAGSDHSGLDGFTRAHR